jgi:hypothetical protein
MAQSLTNYSQEQLYLTFTLPSFFFFALFLRRNGACRSSVVAVALSRHAEFVVYFLLLSFNFFQLLECRLQDMHSA